MKADSENLKLSDAQLALLARVCILGLSGVKYGESWHFIDAWTPDCDMLLKSGLARMEIVGNNKRLCKMRLSAAGRRMLETALKDAIAREEKLEEYKNRNCREDS